LHFTSLKWYLTVIWMATEKSDEKLDSDIYQKKIRGALTQRPNCFFFFQTVIDRFFCSALSKFEKFLLCERILINVTTCQNETPN
jgi:hypothetical protein